MKKATLLRMLSLLLAVLLLTGCVKRETIPPEPAQEQMPQEELNRALSDIDLAVLCAGLSTNQRLEQMENPFLVTTTQVVCADYDQDGFQEVLLGRHNHITFSNDSQRVADFTFAQSSPVYYTDHAGNIYRCSTMGDGFDVEVDGKPAWTEHMYGYYGKWNAGQWEEAYSYGGTVTAVEYTNENGETVWEVVEDNVDANLQGRSCTKAELDAHFEEIGMREIIGQPAAHTSYSYNVIYRDSLLEALDGYFSQNYSGYSQMLRQDIDGDGIEEALFFLPDFEMTWYDALQCSDQYSEIRDAQEQFQNAFSDDYNHTGVVIVKEDWGVLTVSAYCLLQTVSPYEGMDIRVENGYLWIDGTCSYLGGRFADISGENVPAELFGYLSEYGYENHFLRMVDVSDYDGDEYMCICRRNGTWYIIIFVIIHGDPVVLYGNTLGENGVYLTEYEGKQCLLNYYQSVYTMNGEMITNYNYSVDRPRLGGSPQSLDFAHVNYSDKDKDATAVSAFFDKLNRYLIKIIVIRDPFRLAGRMWMDPAEVQHGTAPQEEPQKEPQDTQQPEEKPAQEAVMGFVQIEDPASWLHLRVGPGVEYDKVLMDPSDPDSFVRQALGSPVTVLETVETGDPENPVWLKIRISYADREIVGYSSKNYIRLVNE